MKIVLHDKSEIVINNFSEYSNVSNDPSQLEGILMTIMNPSDDITVDSIKEKLTTENLESFTVERSDGYKTVIDGSKYDLYDIRKIMNEVIFNIEIVLKKKPA